MEVYDVEQVVSDQRGSIIQVVSQGEWKQLNVLKRKAGSLGGGHYHRQTHEFFYLIKGKMEVKTMSVKNSSVQSYTFQEGACFSVPPYEQHYMAFKDESILVTLYSEPFDINNPDVFVDEKLPSLNLVFNHDEQ